MGNSNAKFPSSHGQQNPCYSLYNVNRGERPPQGNGGGPGAPRTTRAGGGGALAKFVVCACCCNHCKTCPLDQWASSELVVIGARTSK